MSITPTNSTGGSRFFFFLGTGASLIGLGLLLWGFVLFRNCANSQSQTAEAGFRVESTIHRIKNAVVGGEYPIPYVFINDADRPARIVGLTAT